MLDREVDQPLIVSVSGQGCFVLTPGKTRGDWLPSGAKCLSPSSCPESLSRPRKWESVSGQGCIVLTLGKTRGTGSRAERSACPPRLAQSHSVGLGPRGRGPARPRTKQPCDSGFFGLTVGNRPDTFPPIVPSVARLRTTSSMNSGPRSESALLADRLTRDRQCPDGTTKGVGLGRPVPLAESVCSRRRCRAGLRPDGRPPPTIC
jgi:hypothetical protein